MTGLVKAHAKALMPSFGGGKEDHHVMESLTRDITQLIKKSEKRLQELSVKEPSEDSNVRKNVQSMYLKRLQQQKIDLLSERLTYLRKKQSMYLKRLQQQKEFIASLGVVFCCCFCYSHHFNYILVYGHDGVDLEMNWNGSKSRLEDDEFIDMGIVSFGLAVVLIAHKRGPLFVSNSILAAYLLHHGSYESPKHRCMGDTGVYTFYAGAYDSDTCDAEQIGEL